MTRATLSPPPPAAGRPPCRPDRTGSPSRGVTLVHRDEDPLPEPGGGRAGSEERLAQGADGRLAGAGLGHLDGARSAELVPEGREEEDLDLHRAGILPSPGR